MADKGRGGLRSPGTLFVGKWRLGRTAPIRVPEVLAEPLLNLARRIDVGELPVELLEQLDPELPDKLGLVASGTQSDARD